MPSTVHKGLEFDIGKPVKKKVSETHEVATSLKKTYIGSSNIYEIFQAFGLDYTSSQLYEVIEDIGPTLGPDVILAGGCIVRALLGKDIFHGDIDVWPVLTDTFSHVRDMESKFGKAVVSKYAYNFNYSLGIRKTKIHLIIPPEPKSVASILNSFDMTYCQIAIKWYKGKVEPHIVTNIASLAALANKRIILNNVNQPLSTFSRLFKAKKLGFDVDEALLLLAKQISLGGKPVDYSKLYGREKTASEIIAELSSGEVEITDAKEDVLGYMS